MANARPNEFQGYEPHDPRTAELQPPFPPQSQEPPGSEAELDPGAAWSEAELDPRPDYGEQTYKGFGRLEGRVALISGGDSGIGRAVALAFAREGADVVGADLDEPEDGETVGATGGTPTL